MPTLFSYVVRDDGGAAPNPFWDVCTLVICKPKIRRYAEINDWVVGTGSAKSPVGDVRDSVVYAMRVTTKMPMHEYDAWVQENLPGKVPDCHSADPRRKLGDAIYDFSDDPPGVRQGVHTIDNREHDLHGEYALLSEHFFYFGDQPLLYPSACRGWSNVGRGIAHMKTPHTWSRS